MSPKNHYGTSDPSRRYFPRLRVHSASSQVEQTMEDIGADPAGINLMVPKAQVRCIALDDVETSLSLILKQEMLALGGDAVVTRGAVDFSQHQTGVLLIGTEKQLAYLIKKLQIQPFGLKNLGEELTDLLAHINEAEEGWPRGKRLDCRGHILDLGMKTHIMGVLNVTPDSFSDGGLYSDPKKAIEHGKEMVSQGADIIDIGGESTRPGSDPVPLEEELSRVLPVIEGLIKEVDIPISIDTIKPEVARAALEAGAHLVNDINGLRNPQMAEVVAEHQVPLVIMHMKGTPKEMQISPDYTDVMGEIIGFFRERVSEALAAGIPTDKIILDPGIGFGKRLQDNYTILHRLKEFTGLGHPLLIGPSRKSFIGATLDSKTEGRFEGTLASLVIGIMNNADIIRVHDVKECMAAAKMADAILGRKGK